jgi:folate-dependent tRNA-U54 methylase TrmFO/GidA
MRIFTYGLVKDGEVREATTLGVCWNLIGQEGNISSVAAGLLVNKAAARNHKNKNNLISHNITK